MAVRVLLVDDEESLRRNMVAYLEDEGFEVTGASCGEDAIECVEAGASFDVCVMDLRLPGIDGHETVRVLHRLRPEMLFLVHTGTAGYALPDDLSALGLNDDHVFEKPMTDATPLAEAIRRLAQSGAYE